MTSIQEDSGKRESGRQKKLKKLKLPSFEVGCIYTMKFEEPGIGNHEMDVKILSYKNGAYYTEILGERLSKPQQESKKN